MDVLLREAEDESDGQPDKQGGRRKGPRYGSRAPHSFGDPGHIYKVHTLPKRGRRKGCPGLTPSDLGTGWAFFGKIAAVCEGSGLGNTRTHTHTLPKPRVGAAWTWWQGGEWRGQGSFLGSNKEVFDAEVYALQRAVRLLSDRGETGMGYTVFSDSQAAIFRLLHEECGPAQALAREAIEASRELRARNNDITIRWTPSHRGVTGKERADALAKRAAAGELAQADPGFLQEASLAHLTRRTTGSRALETSNWIRAHVKRRHRYRPPPGGKMRRELRGVRKELAGRYYQLLSGHAATATHLKRIGQISSEDCWWCGSGERQTRLHLFSRCRRWTPEIRELWRRLNAEGGGCPRAPSVCRLFGDPQATEAVLDFLRSTWVGRLPGLAMFGIMEDEPGRELELWAEDESPDDEGDEGGPGPP